MIRERRIKSGKLFEADFYPVFSDGRRVPSRAPKTKRSTEEQARYNKRQAEKKLVRLVNANFEEGDIIMHPTYDQQHAPGSEERARRDIVNYLRRVKTKRASELKRVSKLAGKNPEDKRLAEQLKKLEQPFRYIYVIEKVTYKTGKRAGTDNYHFHLFMTGGIDRDTLERMWTNGARTNADRFQPDKFGAEAAAKYIAKAPQGAKSFCASRNLKKPELLKPRDGRISKNGLEKLATQRVCDREYWERKYKGYRFLRCYSRFNEYNMSWYVSVVMYKDANAPPWNAESWIDDE